MTWGEFKLVCWSALGLVVGAGLVAVLCWLLGG